MNTCKNFVDSIKNADFTGIFRLIMKEPSYFKSSKILGPSELFIYHSFIQKPSFSPSSHPELAVDFNKEISLFFHLISRLNIDLSVRLLVFFNLTS